MDHLSKNIKLLRNLKEISQTEIAASLDFNRTTWNNYESGVSTPSLEGVFKIAKYFGVSVDDLVMKDLITDVNLIAKYKDSKYWEKVNLNVNALVNAITKKEGKSSPSNKANKEFNPSLNEAQMSFKSIEAQLHDLSSKIAKIEANTAKSLATMEDKIKALAKGKAKM